MKTVRVAQATAGALLLLVLTACGSGEPSVMPDVIGTQLDLAKSNIERAGFGDDVEIVGGGFFGIVDESNWVVCEQEPAAGEIVSNPRLVVDRECSDTNTSEEPSAEPTGPSVAPSLATNITATTVDELLDRLNSAGMGGIQVGDQFRFTGELTMSELWYTGATGYYTVLLKAHDGADDLMILLDESDAAGWTEGTSVEMVVENVEIELQGETTDGWLRLVSASPLL